ncbi:MAG: NAD-dependent epimerase/dehydratase family protein [Propionibacteriaceae bacterium]|jgi:dTDP-6-deoxy-L-talose 4-dehydrogenase (NAD+)|nr:NAD-dependent epimerase/dehydratase family protein [Propionibacteriaceae bacterium]
MSERVLVTGAAGYIGKHVLAALLDQGHAVIASDVAPDGIDPRAEVVPADIFAPEASGADLFDRLGRPDTLIHLAWKDGFVHNSPAHMAGLSDHVRFLNAMAAGGCGRIAVMGSMHEVGYHEGAIDETTPCAPLSQYGVAKNALRQSLLLSTQNQEVNLYWLRAYYIVGDDLRGSSIFSKIARAAADGQREFPFTSGRNRYDFIDIDQLARQIVAASTQDAITGVINVCTGRPVSLAERVEQYIRDHGYDIALQYGAFPDRPYDSPGVWGDATKIQTIMAGRERKTGHA